jgi:hypothetical protein
VIFAAILVASLVWFAVGYGTARLRVHKRNSPIDKVSGVSFPWEVETVASRVILGLLSDKTFLNEKERRLLIKKARQTSVEFHATLPIAGTWSVHREGFLVRLKRDDVWRGRFAQAFAHALHLTVRGSADGLNKDAMWFELAKRHNYGESDRSEAEMATRTGDEAGALEHGGAPV